MARPKFGSCTTCGHSPVAVDARVCPRCGARNPNPGVANRFAGRGMLYGLGAGAAVGAAVGWDSGHPGMTFGGALLGAIPGLFAGLVVGLVAAAMSGLTNTVRPQVAAGSAVEEDQPENVYVQFAVDGRGTDADLALRERVERVLDDALLTFEGGHCGGGDMGSGKATVFLAVRHPTRAIPKLLDALRREGLGVDRFLVAEDTGDGYKVWWPQDYRGRFSLL